MVAQQTLVLLVGVRVLIGLHNSSDFPQSKMSAATQYVRYQFATAAYVRSLLFIGFPYWNLPGSPDLGRLRGQRSLLSYEATRH